MKKVKQAAPEELSAERAIREVRNLRTAGLWVGNMRYVDLLLAEHDRLTDLLAARDKEVPKQPSAAGAPGVTDG